VSAGLSTDVQIARSHFELVGGQAAVDQIVEEFYRRMDVEPAARVIRALHPSDLSGSKAILKRYLAEWLGGPAAYSQERGHPRLRMRHAPFRIGAAERDAWMQCMTGAMQQVVGSARLRDLLLQLMYRIADSLRNVGFGR
jgi:hemoglobin